MKFLSLTLIALLLAAGCRTGPRPEAGMAALRVKLIAEPKAGAPTSPTALTTHDTPTAQSYGPHARVDYAHLENIVVWIEPASGAAPPQSKPAAPLDVKVDPEKSSHGIDAVVCVGQKIIFHNVGAIPQSIYSASDGNDFDLPSVAPSATGEYAVRSPGLIEVFADASKDIAVQLFATPTRWAAVGRAGETLDFNNIPPGRYQIVSWHPRLPGSSEPVELTANKVNDASIKVGVNSLPKVTADVSR